MDTDPLLLSVTPEHFAEHLEYLSEHYNPISLSELYLALKRGKIPDKSVVITFDDGYADNLWNAKPLLEKNNIPATVFITSGYVDSDREFWWDDLERLLLLPDELPDQLELTIKEEKWNWNLTRGITSRPRVGFEAKPKSWNITMASDPGPQYTLYRDLHRHMKHLSYPQQEYILSILAQWVGTSKIGRETHKCLTISELRSLDRGDLIEIGAHTKTHIMLSMQQVFEQKKEIILSKKTLEKLLGHHIISFSYPFGGRADFNKRTSELIKQAGFCTACANYGSTIIGSADPHCLPRALVRNWDIEVFSSRIKEWFNE